MKGQCIYLDYHNWEMQNKLSESRVRVHDLLTCYAPIKQKVHDSIVQSNSAGLLAAAGPVKVSLLQTPSVLYLASSLPILRSLRILSLQLSARSRASETMRLSLLTMKSRSSPYDPILGLFDVCSDARQHVPLHLQVYGAFSLLPVL